MTAAITERTGSIMNVAVQSTSVRTEESSFGFTTVMDSVSESLNGQKDSIVSQSEKTSYSENYTNDTQNAEYETDMKDVSNNDTEGMDSANDVREETVEVEHASEQTKASGEAENTSDQAKDAMENGEEAASTQMYQTMMEQAEALIKQAADGLSMDVSDIMKAMKQLHMDTLDILNPNQMQELALALTGENRASLLTDEKLYQMVQMLTEMSEKAMTGLQEKLSVNADEWNGLMEQMAELSQKSQLVEQTNSPNISITNHENANLRMAVMKEAQNAEANSKEQSDSEASSQAGKQFDANVSMQADEDSTVLQNEFEMENGNQQLFADTLMKQTNEVVEKLLQDDYNTDSNVDINRIMKQIMDNMRVIRNGEMSEIEMQLHPHELGTLHVSVAAKNGVVTAQFAAQNEVVKEALESQIMILKDNLEEQGVKVEAVEVTIASHEFERNLEQDAQKEAEQAEEIEARKKATRRIQMDGFAEEDDENLDEADRITKDMMMRHGSSLDYLV